MDFKTKIVHELHRSARKNFPRRNVVLKGINDLFQADLIDLTKHSKVNKGFKYLLNVINCFTKYAYSVPLKNKNASSVSNAMKHILQGGDVTMRYLQTDDGKEFYNSLFQAIMKKHNIHHYSTKSEKKASIIERFNRTLK